MKSRLREAGVPEFEIRTCLDYSQLVSLLAEFTDKTYAAACLLQRHWRTVLERRRASTAVQDLHRQGVSSASAHGDEMLENN